MIPSCYQIYTRETAYQIYTDKDKEKVNIYGNIFFIFIRIYLISYFTRIYLVTARNQSAGPNPTQKGKTLFFSLYILMSPVANFNI